MREPLETDYLVVGTGAAGMAFTDALLSHSDATVTLVDRRHAPGGHWIDAYPFVRLHQPAKRLQVFESLRAAGIGVNVHYIPVHTQPYYQKLGFDWGQFPDAEQFYSQIISLPLFAGITPAQQQQVADALRLACSEL